VADAGAADDAGAVLGDAVEVPHALTAIASDANTAGSDHRRVRVMLLLLLWSPPGTEPPLLQARGVDHDPRAKAAVAEVRAA